MPSSKPIPPFALRGAFTSGQLSLRLKDEALDALEVARAGWITKARSWAVAYCRMHGSVTTDDLHAYCPPPADIDPRIMGAIMRQPQFRVDGYMNSKRRECHGRLICVFVLGETS